MRCACSSLSAFTSCSMSTPECISYTFLHDGSFFQSLISRKNAERSSNFYDVLICFFMFFSSSSSLSIVFSPTSLVSQLHHDDSTILFRSRLQQLCIRRIQRWTWCWSCVPYYVCGLPSCLLKSLIWPYFYSKIHSGMDGLLRAIAWLFKWVFSSFLSRYLPENSSSSDSGLESLHLLLGK